MTDTAGFPKLVAASAAGIIGFALAGVFWSALGPVEGWSFLAMLVALPAFALALMPLAARAFCLALLAMLGAALMDISGPDNPLLILPLAAGSFLTGAVIAEACVRMGLRWRRLRAQGKASG